MTRTLAVLFTLLTPSTVLAFHEPNLPDEPLCPPESAIVDSVGTYVMFFDD